MKLKDARTSKFLSTRDLAQAAGVSHSTVAAIESGRELPMLRTARKLAEALGIEPTDVDEFKAALARARGNGAVG